MRHRRTIGSSMSLKSSPRSEFRGTRGLCRRYGLRGARAASELDGVLVWVNPISEGQDRTTLDAMLRDVASRGIWVSAHPDVILKMGAKEVLHRTRHLGWGTDTHLYRTARAFREEFPAAASVGGPACPQAESRQRRPGRLEGRARFPDGLRGGRSFACCRHAGAACPKTCRSAIS